MIKLTLGQNAIVGPHSSGRKFLCLNGFSGPRATAGPGWAGIAEWIAYGAYARRPESLWPTAGVEQNQSLIEKAGILIPCLNDFYPYAEQHPFAAAHTSHSRAK